jgi:flagellar hook-associated protein 2
MDWQTTVQELATAERAPETQWKATQTTINNQNSAFTSIQGDLALLQTDMQSLQDPSLYESSAATTSNSSVATATAASGTTPGSYAFNISQLATAALITGTSNISQSLSPDGNLSAITVGTAGFATPVTAGTFTVDGNQITLNTTDSLQQVFDNIATATNNTVTASYDSGTDKITLTSSDNSEIVLGSAADTSNFLQVAGLYNNQSGSVSSNAALGRVQLSASMANADLATVITDGGSGQGQFTINGVSISYDASTDSVQDVLDRINGSSAGVTASYDSLNNRFLLTNNSTGDVGITMQDVTGNFLAATGLSAGTLTRGQNLLYTLNGSSQQFVSQSNTIAQASSTISGLSVTAVGTGQVTVNVNHDTSGITAAIQNFIKDYNAVQSYISSQQTVTTASDGTVTAGLLTGDQTADDIASSLRSLSFSGGFAPGSSNTISTLSALGIQTNSKDNTLSLSDTTALDSALANNLNGVKAFFSDPTNGLATQLNNYINSAIGDNGTLLVHEGTLSSQSGDITTQISNLENKITSDTSQWTTEFENMEQAQAQVNQELTYLSEQVSNGSL